jgi:hypothetical protein
MLGLCLALSDSSAELRLIQDEQSRWAETQRREVKLIAKSQALIE